MNVGSMLYRLTNFARRNGIRRSAGRAMTMIINRLFYNKEILFRFDLSDPSLDGYNLPDGFAIDHFSSAHEPPKHFLVGIVEHDNMPMETFVRKAERRFKKGSDLWILTHGADFIGYLWSIGSTTMEPYYFPLTAKDVHLMDNQIFPQFRGKNYNYHLYTYVLGRLRQRGFERIVCETAFRNTPIQKSLAKIRFQPYAVASTFTMGKRHITIWRDHDHH